MGVVLKVSTIKQEHYAGDTLEGCVEMEVISVSAVPYATKD